jgi:hypothetical protein
MASVIHRIHDRAAERLRWVQFPRQRFVPLHVRAPFFRHAMPWPTRVTLAVISVVVLLFSTIALFFLGLLIWALFAA